MITYAIPSHSKIMG